MIFRKTANTIINLWRKLPWTAMGGAVSVVVRSAEFKKGLTLVALILPLLLVTSLSSTTSGAFPLLPTTQITADTAINAQDWAESQYHTPLSSPVHSTSTARFTPDEPISPNPSPTPYPTLTPLQTNVPPPAPTRTLPPPAAPQRTPASISRASSYAELSIWTNAGGIALPDMAADSGAGTDAGATGESEPDADEADTPPRPPEPSRNAKVAYITIDDGPSRSITPEILDILAQEGIKATFFVLPHGGVEDIYQRIINEGHEIGNHSYSHNYSRLYQSDDVEPFREDVIRAREYMLENYGYLTTAFRFPGGAMGRNSSIIEPRREILAELDYRDFDWHIDTGDARASQEDKSAPALVDNVLNNTRGREHLIVLMHDTRDKITTLEALPIIIEGLREQGYVFDIIRNYPQR